MDVQGSVNFPLASKKKLFIPIELILLVSGRLLLQLMLYRAGFMALTADEFGRTVLAARWAQHPYMLWNGPWLPFHMYLFGTALRLKMEMLWVPRVIVILFGALSILLMYLLTSQLFGSRRVGLISAFLLAVNPVHVWLSSTPLTEIPHATFALAGLLGLVLYLKYGKQRYIYLGAFALALASGFRFEAWILSIFFDLALIWSGIQLYKQGALDSKRLFNLAVGSMIPWLFPVAWMAGNYLETGNPLYFMEYIKTYKLTWYGRHGSYLHYLKTFLRIDPYTTVLAIFGIGLCWLHHPKSWAVRWYSVVMVAPFLLFAYLHGGQTEPPGNYFRYLSFFIFLIYPAVAYLIDTVVSFVGRSWLNKRGVLGLLFLILGVMGLTQTYRTFQFVNDPSAEGLAVGQRIRSLRVEHPEIAQRPVLIELSYWQYLAIHVGANDVSSIVYDRTLDLEHRQSSSFIATNAEALRDYLTRYQFSYVVVKSPELRSIIEQNLGILPSEEVNGYAFYRLVAQ